MRAIEVRPRSAVRCALCHDALGSVGVTCPGCGTRMHVECVPGACPTLGCGRDFAQVVARARAFERPLVRRGAPRGPVAEALSPLSFVSELFSGRAGRLRLICICLTLLAWGCVVGNTARSHRCHQLQQ